MSGPAHTSTVEGEELGVGAAATAPLARDRGPGPTIGFLGPVGTFSQVAAQRLTSGWGGELVPVELEAGQSADLDDVVQALADAAYSRVDLVEKRGFGG